MTYATISVNYNTFPTPAGVQLQTAALAPLAANSLFLAYYSADISIGFNNVNPLAPLGGDVFLGAFTTGGVSPTTDGDILGGSAPVFAQAGGGRTWIAVFDMAFGAYVGSIPIGTSYGLGPISQTLIEWNATLQPDAYGPNIVAPIVTNLQTIPEPGSMALMVLGIGMVAVRRFRKK